MGLCQRIIKNYRDSSVCISCYLKMNMYIYKLQLFCSRKSIYKSTPSFLHFNLALALLIALIFFVSGVETAKENKVIILFDTYVANQLLCFLLCIGYLYSSCDNFTLFLLGCICMDAV